MNNPFVILETYVYVIMVVVIILALYYLIPKVFELYRLKKIKHKFLSNKEISFLEQYLLPYNFLSDVEKKKLEKKIIYFLNYKTFYPIQDFSITDEMKLIIAAEACLLIVNLDMPVYLSLKSIYISASVFIDKENDLDLQTLLPSHVPRLGESWKDGPLVLSWSSVREGLENWSDGHNVVLHEFSHQLDAMDGSMDGTPILEKGNNYNRWEIFMTKEFLQLRKKVSKHQKSDIDKYGATNEAEFFAVVSEDFFSKAHSLHEKHPELYAIYKDFFKLDPIKWHG